VATTTTLGTAPNPSTVGQSVTITATVVGSNPTGTVNFKDGASGIAACAAQPVSGSGNSRTATCTLNTLTQGAHSLTGVYSGDAGNLTSTSPVKTQTVNGCGPFGC